MYFICIVRVDRDPIHTYMIFDSICLFNIYFSLIHDLSRVVRKSIAKVLTVINQTQKDQLRMFYQGKKYKPLDLRAKKTRALRRALTFHQRTKKTPRAIKKAAHFPTSRLYAVKS